MNIFKFLRQDRHNRHEALLTNSALFQNFCQNKQLSEYEFIVLDTELTGLRRWRDELIAIGAVRIRNLQIDLGDTYYQLIRPSNLQHTDATLIHKLTPEQLRQAPDLPMVLPDFVRFCNGSLLVGHCVELDMNFLNRAVKRVMGGTLANPCIDTMRLARAYKENQWEHSLKEYEIQVSYNLADLTVEYGLPRFKPHNALEDALQTAYLFLFLIKKLKKGGLETLHDLYRAGRTWRWIV